jgi:hypothetical protein
MKVTSMTQRMLASGYIRGWLAGDIDTTEFLARLDVLLQKSYKAPPEGAADGTLKPKAWGALKELMVTTARQSLALSNTLEHLGLDEKGYKEKK